MAKSAALAQAQAVAPVTLTLRNPSPYERQGLVVTPWEPISRLLGSPKHVRVYRDYGQGFRAELPFQIDRIDPDDPSRDELLFALDSPLRAGDEDYGTGCGFAVIEPANSAPQNATGPRAKALFHGAELKHDRFDVWLNTASNHDNPKNHWFGGALASVRWNDHDLLDPIAEDVYLDPDEDRRAAQIDRIHLVRPPWDEDGSFDAYVFDKPWRCVGTSDGPLRATATIVSSPFTFRCRGSDQQPRTFTCTVHRAVSIFAGSDVIAEKIWVRGDVEGPTQAVDMWFSARYFMLVNLSLGAITFRYPNHPGWFAVLSTRTRATHGYAFATDSYAGPIWHPPLEHENPSTGHRAYSWGFDATRLASNAHILRRDTTQQELTDTIGWVWYDLLYKPLRATI